MTDRGPNGATWWAPRWNEPLVAKPHKRPIEQEAHREWPAREYMLTAVNTVVDVHTRVSDLYSNPYNQISEQLRLTIEIVKERQESELINNPEYGLLHNAAANQRVKHRT